MHSIYTTQGIVLESFSAGEANKFFRIFTRELGLVEATAQGIREIKSKNRYGLQDFSISDISLVRGKDIWRITNSAPQGNLFSSFAFSDNFLVINEILVLLKQLIQGEDKNEGLFDFLLDSFKFLENNQLTKKELDNFCLIMKMIILENLGYLDKKGLKLNKETLNNLDEREILREINKALDSSQLINVLES